MKRFRNTVRSLHGYIGLLFGLLFAIVSLTGSGIVFHNEIDHAINQSLHTVVVQPTSIPLDAILPIAQKTHPDLPIQYVSFPKQPDGSYIVTMTDKSGHRLETFVNPYTGTILGERVWEYSLTGFLYTLHHELFLGNTGLIILIVVGIALLLMSITGIVLWTGWRKLKSGFNIRWNAPSSLLNFDLHQTVGFTSQIFLSILAVTGIIITLLHLLPALGAKEVASQPIPNQPAIALSELLQKADAAMPDGQVTSISFNPTQPRSFTVTKHFTEQETGKFDLSTVELDRYSGEVLQVNKVIQPSGFFQVIVTLANLHFGTIAGLPSRILYVFVGLMPAFLLVSGLMMFRDRRWGKVIRQEAAELSKLSGEN